MPVPVSPEFLIALFGAAAASARRAPPPVRAPAAFLAPVPVPVSDAVFEKQTRVVHTYEGREPPNCAVCLEACQPGKTRRLPCGHDYHEDCIKPWFRTNHRCPTCRHDAREGDPPVVAPARRAAARPRRARARARARAVRHDPLQLLQPELQALQEAPPYAEARTERRRRRRRRRPPPSSPCEPPAARRNKKNKKNKKNTHLTLFPLKHTHTHNKKKEEKQSSPLFVF